MSGAKVDVVGERRPWMNQEAGRRGFRRRGVATTAAAQAPQVRAPRSRLPPACTLAPPWWEWGWPARPAQLRRRGKMVEDGAEELEDLVHFSVSELPSRGYGVMEEIRRQGKLCDVTLKGYKTQRPREEEQLPAARTEQPCRAELHGPAVLSLDSTSRRTCVCLLNWGPL